MGGKGGTDVYQSPYTAETDQLGFQNLLGMISGNGIKPSGALNNSTVAQQLGGKYDPKTGYIVMPDGSKIKYNPLTNSYDQAGKDASAYNYKDYAIDPSGTGFQSERAFRNYVNSGKQLYDLQGNQASMDVITPDNPYTSKANEILGTMDENVYNNDSSAWNMYANLGNQYQYNPTSGRYEQASSDIPSQMTSDNYLDKYGSYLDKGYSQSQPYQQFDYQAPQLQSVDNISDAARASIYQRGADRISSTFRDNAQNTEDFISERGGSLSSGRAMALRKADQENKNRDLTQLDREVQTDHELRTYNDAVNRRDKQAAYDWEASMKRGGENQYGYEAGRDENRYAFEDAQKRGRERMGVAESIDSKNRDQAFQELQANRQQTNNQFTALSDMLRIYGGMDSTAAQLEAAKAQAMGGALGGLFSGATSALGGVFDK